MPRLDISPDDDVLTRVLRDPRQLAALSPEAYSRVMDAAELARLLGWIVRKIEDGLVPANCPGWLNDRLMAARARVAEYDRSLLWEITRIEHALADTSVRWLLLKGAAYLAAGLPAGRGRRVADIDILVPEAQLADAERALMARGWEFAKLDPYDDRFYREWMHESPPMVHRDRRSVIDVHHAILPRTSRLHPPSSRILERAIEVQPGVRVPCPSHLILHAAAHLFHDGEISGAIRDLVDLQVLLERFNQDPGFWPDLLEEAARLDLKRPLYYSIRYAEQLLGAAVPAATKKSLAAWGPSPPIRQVMDGLVARAIPNQSGHGSSAATLALYVRSHWLRMPPFLLARHLWRKAFYRPPPKKTDALS